MIAALHPSCGLLHMAEERTQRRLAAILAADIAGYSKLWVWMTAGGQEGREDAPLRLSGDEGSERGE
jgi:hypothetical protein